MSTRLTTRTLRVELSREHDHILRLVQRQARLPSKRLALDYVLEQVDLLDRARLFPSSRLLQEAISRGVAIVPRRRQAVGDASEITCLRMSRQSFDRIETFRRRWRRRTKRETLDYVLREADTLYHCDLLPAETAIRTIRRR